MNKIQIKAEILATLRALSGTVMPSPSLLTDLKKIEDKNTILDRLLHHSNIINIVGRSYRTKDIIDEEN